MRFGRRPAIWFGIAAASVLLIWFYLPGTPKSISSTLTAREKRELNNALQRLDDVLKEKAPALHANLNPPAGKAEIADLRGVLDGNTVESLEMWFQWHNGVSAAPASLLPLGEPISLRRAILERKRIGKIPLVDGLRKSSVKILEDGFGDGYFLDVTSSRPLVFYHMLEDPYPQYYGTLAEFANFIADGFESEVLFLNGAGEFDYDEAKFYALEEKHLNSASRP